MPGASDIPKNKLNEIGKGSESVLEEMRNEGKDIKQIESFVTAGAIFCVYDATSEDLVHEHSKRSGIECGFSINASKAYCKCNVMVLTCST